MLQVINIVKKVHNNLKIELVQWQTRNLRGISFDNKKNIPFS